MKKYLFLFLPAIIFSIISHAQECPKREFRGAWIQCVNGQWIGLGRDRMQQTLRYQLDELQKDEMHCTRATSSHGVAILPAARDKHPKHDGIHCNG